MERKQIYLAEDQVDELNRLAEERKIPVSSMIRDAVAQYIVEQDEPMLDTAEEHPLWGIIGMAKGDGVPADGSVSHDEVIYKPRRGRRTNP
jgi:hypothetical protein